MSKLFVASTGSNTAPYDTWAKAATQPATAFNAAAAGDDVYVHGETFTAGATVTITFAGTPANPVKVFCTNDKSSESPAVESTAGVLETGAGTFALILNGSCFMRGMTLRSGSGATASSVTLANGDDDVQAFESCTFHLPNTSGTSRIASGASGAANNATVSTEGCAFIFGGTGQGFAINTPWVSRGDVFCPSGSVPTTLIMTMAQAGRCTVEGGDLSTVSNTLVAGANTLPVAVELINCKLHATLSRLSSSATPGAEVILRNCSDGDVHYNFEHWDWLGRTEVTTAINVSADGASYDGTNRVAWKITGSSFATFGLPYKSPWIDVYHAGTSAITPYLEALRDGSAAAFTDEEVWSQWSYQGTAGSTRASMTHDRRGVLAAAVAQADGAGLGAWTGESGTAKSIKLGPNSSFTPAEIGDIRARVCVAGAHTVYVDPKIRGL